jgi:geranylgeranyl pyrophosphate synthase
MYFHYIEDELNQYLNSIKSSKLKKMFKYSLIDGKCIRGFIVKHVMNTLSNNKINIWEPIVSIELIHSISLIIDDLPCMDNDKIRRNKPSFFVKFGERESLLLSFYGINQSLKLLMNGINNSKFNQNKYDYILKIINEWDDNVGNKLILGQMLDLKEDIGKLLNISIPNTEDTLMTYKTSSLFSFAFILGSIFSNEQLNTNDFINMGYYFGILYQLMDDAKDMNTDVIDSNFLLKYGKEKAKNLFYKNKNNLINLLEKYNLDTKEMVNLISLIEKKFNENILLDS